MKQSLSFFAQAFAAVALITLTSFFSCHKDDFKGKSAVAVLSGTKEDTVVQGALHFSEQNDGSVKMQLEVFVPVMAGKSVAVHLHEHGMCGNAGADAHGHWNPTGKQHGQWGSASFHAGDIGNIPLNAAGRGMLELTTSLWTIGGADATNILGRGVIVHSGVDDYTSQPAGNSGTRIGCGMIETN